jgi:UDP-N-acetylglucosamine 2-epimerase
MKELIVHTGQHYDYEMSTVFLEELDIPRPNYSLSVGSGSHAFQTGEMLKGIEGVLVDEQTDMVLVYGDTNSTLAGALAAAKLRIPIAHVEAGLRSYQKSMPEEINRVVTDHLSTILFCPSEHAVHNLQREGFTEPFAGGKRVCLGAIQGIDRRHYSCDNPLVVNVGDVMYDCLLTSLRVAEERSSILSTLGLGGRSYYLATVHRAVNTDDPKRLGEIFRALDELASRGARVIFPMHPRTKQALAKLPFLRAHPGLVLIDPVSYYDMLILERHACAILTDSGGVQKEAFLLRVPCVTLREETEWPETVEWGWNRLAGTRPDEILEAISQFESKDREGTPPPIYGDGRAAVYTTHILGRWAVDDAAA